MKKVCAAIAVFAGITLAHEASSQARYGITKVDTKDNRTHYTCPDPAPTICQIWGTNSDGSRFVIVRILESDGSFRSFSVGVKKATPNDDPNVPHVFIIDPEMDDVVWEAASYVE